MENQDVYSIYNLYKERYNGSNINNFLGPELNQYIAGLSDEDKQTLIEYHFKYAIKDDEDIDYVLNQLLIEHEPSKEDLESALDYYHDRGPKPTRSNYGENPDMRPFSRKSPGENAEDIRGFSIGNELFNLYSNLDRDARTRSGSSVSEELKMIIDELDEIVSSAERGGSKFDLIKQLRLD